MHPQSPQSCLTLCDPMDCSLPGSYCPWDSPDKNTGVGCSALLQGNRPSPGIEPVSPVSSAGGFFTHFATLEASVRV